MAFSQFIDIKYDYELLWRMQNQATTTIQLLIKDVYNIGNAIGTHVLEMDKWRTMTCTINVQSILPSRNVVRLFCVCCVTLRFPN